MKNISLPNKELRLLSGQLQNLDTGYTIPQIRSLDKVIRIIETTLKPFADGLDKILSVGVSQASEEEKQKGELKKQKELEDYFKTEGNKKVICSFEDVDFEFIKMVWSKMSTFRGQKEVREAVIRIDDAIQYANEPIFADSENGLKPIEKQITN